MCCEESSARLCVSLEQQPRARLREPVAGPTGVLVQPETAHKMRPLSTGLSGGCWTGRTDDG